MLTKANIALAVALVVVSAFFALAHTKDRGLPNRQVPAVQTFEVRNVTLGGGFAAETVVAVPRSNAGLTAGV